MDFSFIREWVSGHAAEAICWTLIHSLWQGLIFAVITGLILLSTRNSHPSFRYKLLSSQFLVFVCVVFATFIWQWNSVSAVHSLQNEITANTSISIDRVTGPADSAGGPHRLLDTIAGFLSNNIAIIFTVWFLILITKSVKTISSLFYLKHLRTHKAHRPAVYWKNKIAELCERLHITRTVELLESEIIKVPAVFGHLKPVIFVPLGALAGMPPAEMEAVLLHELAHIRRSDYLFNLLQNIAETLLFFNPALLWLSALIREEREHCCDDIAIAQMKDKRQFVESLVRFRETYISNHSNYVVAFPGARNSFINRITRIAMNKNKTLQPAENAFLATSIVIISILVMAFSQDKQPLPPRTVQVMEQPATPLPPVKDEALKTQDTIPDEEIEYRIIYSDYDKSAGRETIVFTKDKKEYKLVKLNGEVAYLLVDDEKVPKEKMGQYSDLIKTITAHMEKMRKEQEVRNEQQRIRNKEQEKRNAEQIIRNQEQEKRNAEQEIRNREQEVRNREQIEQNQRQEEQDKQQIIRNKDQERRNEEQIIRNKEQEKRNAEQIIRNQEQEKRNAEQEIRNKEQEERNKLVENLTADLVADKLIKNKKELRSMSLSENSFYINGEKQSPEVFKKYKAKYEKLVGSTYNFSYDE